VIIKLLITQTKVTSKDLKWDVRHSLTILKPKEFRIIKQGFVLMKVITMNYWVPLTHLRQKPSMLKLIDANLLAHNNVNLKKKSTILYNI
jgi:hypothetical protein